MTEPTDTIARRRKPGIVANTAINGAVQLVSIASTLVFFPLLVKAFGVEDYGVYVLALSVTGIATMFDFGIGASTIRLVARHAAVDDERGLGRVVSSAFGLLLLLGLLIGAVVASLAMIAGSLFNINDVQAETLRTLLLIGAAMQIWYWPSSIAATVLSGLERYDLLARNSVLSTVLGALAILAILLTGAGPSSLMLMGAVVMVVTSIANMIAVFSIKSPKGLALLPSRPFAQEILVGGAPIFVATLTQFFNREQADRIVVGVFIGPAGVVVYEIAAKLSMLVAQLTGLTTSAWLPVASGMEARGEGAWLEDIFIRAARYITLAITPLMAVIVVLSAPFIAVWFGAGFESSVGVARLLVLSQLLVPLYQAGDAVLISKGRLSAWVGWGLLLALLNVGLSIVFVQYFGVAGVALGTFIVGMVDFPLYARLIVRETQITWRRWLSTAKAGYLLLPVPIAVSAVLALTPLVDSFLGVVFAGVVAVGVYWACAYLLVLSPSERAQLGDRLRRLMSAGQGENRA
ncbi:MAG: polysaccharide biosynthesis C-terminal domain-containing protein [Actinobacteria bacterium]|nr:polysaccharide biosynthesis C-terminal domain-containing protein [Actinomycetota bacterium]MCG2807202.1 polysaccharide biosynthesis C-terminal domain-containing protein [Coriobacteriia bacterium]